MTTTIVCDVKSCKYRGDRVCTCHTVYFKDGQCTSNKRVNADEVNYKQLMRAPIPNTCHKERGKYVADRWRVIK